MAVPRNLRRIVDAGVPLMLPLLLMMVALLVARLQPTLATGFIGAMLGHALRSVLTRCRSSVSATSWRCWPGAIR